MKKHLYKWLWVFDPLFALLAIIGVMGLFAKKAMVASNREMKLTTWTFRRMGYLPFTDHYYEPMTFGAEGGRYRRRISKKLFNESKNFDFLKSIARPEEFILEYESGRLGETGFNLTNGSFESGDAEVLFYVIRSIQPQRVIEIGAGNSSLIISAALKMNLSEGSRSQHIIVEPYENKWLESLDARVIRERVETVDFSIFEQLQNKDILFIDSSHVVKPENDCVFEYTELLPALPAGVIVHVHDVFTPYDYPSEWINKRRYVWTEQYILEALLLNSLQWEVLAPLNWLSKDSDQFQKYCPYFETGRMPGSIWLKKIN